jgi:hypothetical protein
LCQDTARHRWQRQHPKEVVALISFSAKLSPSIIGLTTMQWKSIPKGSRPRIVARRGGVEAVVAHLFLLKVHLSLAIYRAIKTHWRRNAIESNTSPAREGYDFVGQTHRLLITEKLISNLFENKSRCKQVNKQNRVLIVTPLMQHARH